MRECKKLIAYRASHDRDDAIPYTIEAIAETAHLRRGAAGMQAFLRKA